MSAIDRAALVALITSKIKTASSPKTSAADLREVLNACIESLVAIIDDKDVDNGYLGIDENGRVDITKITAITPSGLFLMDDGTWAYPVPKYKRLFDSFITTANVITTETELIKDDLASGQLAAIGDTIEFEYSGSIVGSATATRIIKVYFGGNLIFNSGALTVAAPGTNWVLKGNIMRSASDAVRVNAFLMIARSTQQNYINLNELTSLNFAAPFELKLTGEAGGTGAATNDITKFKSIVNYIKST